jgi:Domain of unknown function (DUF4365)
VQHRRENESRKAFEAILPSRHVFRREDPDYGFDGEVEEFDENDEGTGRRFRVQLKATSKTGAAAMRERIELDTAAYYRAQQLPVLMVRYVASTGRLYGRWFHGFDPYHEHVGETHLMFHWGEEDELDETSFDKLFEDVERIARVKAASLPLPLSVSTEIPEDGAHGYSPTELELTVDAAFARCPSVLERVAEGDRADVTIAIEDDEVRASIADVTSATFHLDEGIYPPETPAWLVVADALTCIAIALARAGHGEPAARIVVPVFPHSLLSVHPEPGIDLAAAMVRAGRVVEVVEIAETLDQDAEEGRETTGLVFMEAVRANVKSLQPHEASGTRRRSAPAWTGASRPGASNTRPLQPRTWVGT